jgi:t-SNARE complex subunit (syntaxin)
VREDAAALAHAVGEANAMLVEVEAREQAAKRRAEVLTRPTIAC